jgi:hypothetical protein
MSPRNSFAELKRRNVYNVAVAYAVLFDRIHSDPRWQQLAKIEFKVTPPQ